MSWCNHVLIFLNNFAHVTEVSCHTWVVEQDLNQGNTNLECTSLDELLNIHHWMIHWNENVFILMKVSSLAAPKVVILTTFGAASDEDFIKMKTFSFQCIILAIVTQGDKHYLTSAKDGFIMDSATYIYLSWHGPYNKIHLYTAEYM